ncbi:30S ribosomal protein S4e [Caldiplasma sukawensis]
MIVKTKRQMIPRSIKIRRKEYFWGVSSRPGQYRRTESLPLLHLLRDYIQLGDREREITRALVAGKVKVNGKKVKDRRYGTGLMDVVSIEDLNLHFRIMYDKLGRLVPVEESKENSKIKIKRVKNIITVKNGKHMIVFNDGTNLISDTEKVKPGDSVVYNFETKKIEGHIKLQQGSRVFLIGGSHIGTFAVVKSIEVSKSSSSNLVKTEEGFGTLQEYVFPVGTFKFGTGGDN